MSPQPPRRIIRMERQHLANEPGGNPVWLVVHSTYSDGSDIYEVHAMDGAFPPVKFQLRADLQHYLRKHGYHRPLENPSASNRL